VESGNYRLEPTILLLAFLFMFLVCCMFLSEWLFRSDSEFFQAISQPTSNVLGAMLGIITGYKLGTAASGQAAKIEKPSNPPVQPTPNPTEDVK
jgi:hypothetical protein